MQNNKVVLRILLTASALYLAACTSKKNSDPAKTQPASRLRRARNHTKKAPEPKVGLEQQTQPAPRLRRASTPQALQQSIDIPSWTNGREVLVANGVTKKMTGYRFFGTHYPVEFYITANEQEIYRKESDEETSPKQPKKVTLKDNKLEVVYYARFKNDRESSMKFTFEVKPEAKNLDIAFHWKKKPRIRIDESAATLAEEIAIVLNKNKHKTVTA